MKISMDGVRRNLARAFNNVVADYHCSNDRATVEEHLNDLRNVVATILLIYDEETMEKENDFHELSKVADNLLTIGQDEDEDLEDEHNDCYCERYNGTRDCNGDGHYVCKTCARFAGHDPDVGFECDYGYDDSDYYAK